MAKTLHKALIALLFFVLITSRAYAISMGTVVKNDFDRINIGESAKFTVLFWNIGSDYRVELDVKETPENWTIIIYPNNFILNSSAGKEYIKLPYKDSSIKATPVDIIVKPTESVKSGIYEITVVSKSEPSDGGIEFSQERMFNFSVDVENPLYFDKTKNQTLNEKNNPSNMTAEDVYGQKKPDSNYFYSIMVTVIIFMVIIVSFVIYRYL